jgi:transcriptional regulator with XRE-family HTH domain
VKNQTERSQNRQLEKPRSSTTRKRRPNSADIQVGESIRAHRLIAGISQSDLAKQLGVSFQQIQKYEKGANRVGAGRLPQIAELFNVPISALFKGYADTSPGKRTGSAVPVRLISDQSALELLTAYADITDRAIRRCLVELVDRIAKAATKRTADIPRRAVAKALRSASGTGRHKSRQVQKDSP